MKTDTSQHSRQLPSLPTMQVDWMIHLVRGQKVTLDHNLAQLYHPASGHQTEPESISGRFSCSISRRKKPETQDHNIFVSPAHRMRQQALRLQFEEGLAHDAYARRGSLLFAV